MTAKIAPTIKITAGLSAALANVVVVLALGARQRVVAFKHRRELERLVDLDDRLLSDLGLTRDDLRNALSVSLWSDPTTVLTRRIAELRSARHRRSAVERADRVSDRLASIRNPT